MANIDVSTLSPPAKDAYDLFEAVFYHLDTKYSKHHPGLITLEKFIALYKAMGMDDSVAQYETLLQMPHVLIQIYEALEVEYYIVPPETSTPFATFNAPQHAAMTRAGYIKFLAVSFLIELDEGKSDSYDQIVKVQKQLGFTYAGTNTPLPPISEKNIMDMNTTLFAGALRIPMSNIRKNWASLNPVAVAENTATTSAAGTSEADRKRQLAEQEFEEAESFERAQADMNTKAREIALLNQATRLADAQTREMMRQADYINGVRKEKRGGYEYTYYDF